MDSETKVVNLRNEKYDIYIGRGSMWGNPFRIGPHGTRAQVIESYRQWLNEQINFGRITTKDLLSLDGKRLGCYCNPKPCHGDVIIEAITWAKNI